MEKILEKSEDLSLCKHISENGHSSLYGIIRRLSITIHSNDFTTCIENSHVRSLFLFANKPQHLREDFLRRIFIECRHLKVLEYLHVSDFKMLKTNILHEKLGSLIHMKYFSSMGTSRTTQLELPKSIAMLQNLETLDLSDWGYYKIPKVVSKLRKLQHLLSFRMSLFKLKGGIGGMESLQTLSSVQIDDYDDGLELIKELGKLRKLSLFHVMEDHMCTLSSSLNEMQHLENLSIHCRHFTDLHLNPPPSMLRSLKLRGMLVKFPEWILQLQNLVKLKLELSLLNDDSMKFLENMQNLLSLSISREA